MSNHERRQQQELPGGLSWLIPALLTSFLLAEEKDSWKRDRADSK